MINDITRLILLNAFVIAGFHLAAQKDNILYFIQAWSKRHVSEFWRKPIYDCPTCMASYHSTYVFIPFAIIINPLLLLIYPTYILCLAGVSTMTFGFIEVLKKYGEDKCIVKT